MYLHIDKVLAKLVILACYSVSITRIFPLHFLQTVLSCQSGLYQYTSTKKLNN
uniref:Uncharacterized protein n=1 Tax=Nelumbo nucifera TaxID=4432 RepID=A0A822YXU1_NELNU|nr:TPA_asm: hypothetical protein HUJ06_004708 [Nelumbo nucifera]